MELLPKTMREYSPVAYALAKNDLERDRIEHDRIISRRDALRDKLRSGLTALNGGSLVALIAALNGEGGAARWIGIDQSNAKYVAACFVLGLFFAAWSYRVAEVDTTYESADSESRVGSAARRIALHESPPTQANKERLSSEFETYAALPLVGHRVTTQERWAIGLSQLAWTTGILTPLLSALFGW